MGKSFCLNVQEPTFLLPLWNLGANSLTHLWVCSDASEERSLTCILPPHLHSHWQTPEAIESINMTLMWMVHTLILFPLPIDLQEQEKNKLKSYIFSAPVEAFDHCARTQCQNNIAAWWCYCLLSLSGGVWPRALTLSSFLFPSSLQITKKAEFSRRAFTVSPSFQILLISFRGLSDANINRQGSTQKGACVCFSEINEDFSENIEVYALMSWSRGILTWLMTDVFFTAGA